MTKEFKIERVADFMALSDEEFGRMLPDFLVWFKLCKEASAAGAEVRGFRWLDDGRPGELHSVEMTIKDTGEVQIIPGSAFT